MPSFPAWGIGRCHLATHSTGGLISIHMLLAEPERFGKVFVVSPVGPMGLRFPPESVAWFQSMKASREKTRKALTAASVFRLPTLAPGLSPDSADHATEEQKKLFERLVDQAFAVSDGIRCGIPFHLNQVWQSREEAGGLRDRQGLIGHEHLILWGSLDPFIPCGDMEDMAATMPNCWLLVIPDVGHSLLIERSEFCAKHVAQFF